MGSPCVAVKWGTGFSDSRDRPLSFTLYCLLRFAWLWAVLRVKSFPHGARVSTSPKRLPVHRTLVYCHGPLLYLGPVPGGTPYGPNPCPLPQIGRRGSGLGTEHVSSVRAGRSSVWCPLITHTLHWSPGTRWALQQRQAMRSESRESLSCVCRLHHRTWALELGPGVSESCLSGDLKREF